MNLLLYNERSLIECARARICSGQKCRILSDIYQKIQKFAFDTNPR